MRVLVFGGPAVHNGIGQVGASGISHLIYWSLNKIAETERLTVLIHGKSTKVDSLCQAWASHRGLKIEAFPPNWELLKRQIGKTELERLLRASAPNLVVLFVTGGNDDTKMLAKLTYSASIPTIFVEFRSSDLSTTAHITKESPYV